MLNALKYQNSCNKYARNTLTIRNLKKNEGLLIVLIENIIAQPAGLH